MRYAPTEAGVGVKVGDVVGVGVWDDGAVGEGVRVASSEGGGVGLGVRVGVARRVGDGGGVEGVEGPVGDACGVDVQLNARESVTNPNIIARSLLIVAEACRGAPNGHAWFS